MEDLREALKKLRQDIESQAGLPEKGPAPASAPAEAPRARPSGPASFVKSAQPVADEPGPKRPVLPSVSAPVPGYLQGKEVLPGRSEPDPRGGSGRGKASLEPRASGAPVFPKVLLALGFGAAAAGAFFGIGVVLGGGLAVCLAGVLAGGLAPERSAEGDGEELHDLGLRVSALERRISAGSRAADSGSVSKEVVEEIVELRRILTSLFKALGKPTETP